MSTAYTGPQEQISMHTAELARTAKTMVEMHLASDTLVHAEIQRGMIDMKAFINSLDAKIEDRFSSVNKRLDWLMVCILAGVGTAALTVFAAMFPWRAL